MSIAKATFTVLQRNAPNETSTCDLLLDAGREAKDKRGRQGGYKKPKNASQNVRHVEHDMHFWRQWDQDGSHKGSRQVL